MRNPFFIGKQRNDTRNELIILAATSVFAVLAYASRHLTSIVPLYFDEREYIRCGLRYVGGAPPLLCNFEHPPLGKYLIGLFASVNAGMILLVLSYFLSLLALYRITYALTSDRRASSYAMLLTGFDTLFMFTYMHYLLDPIASALVLVTTYLGIEALRKAKMGCSSERRHMLLFGAFLGLALATKWQVAYPLLGMLVAIFWSYFTKFNLKSLSLRLTELFAIAALVYSSTFVMDLTLGALKPLYHNLMALSYMSYRHGLSPPLAMIGVMKLLSRVEVWRLAPFIIMYVTTVSVAPNTTSVILLNSTSVEPGARALVRIGVGVPSVLWPILFPAYLLVIKARLERGAFRELDPVIVVASAAMLNLLNGPLDWYYVYVVPFLYVIATAYILSHRRGGYVAAALLIAQLIQCFLFFSRVIPYAVEIPI